MTDAAYKFLAIAALVLGVLAGGALALHHYGESRYKAGEAATQAKWDAKEKVDAEVRAADARQQVKFNDKVAGDHAEKVSTLTNQLEAANAKIAQLSGRACLSADTVGVLNATGVLDGPAAAGEPASAPEAASSGTGLRYSTDKDVAGYIALCRTRYAEVADQLNKILDIEDQRHPHGK